MSGDIIWESGTFLYALWWGMVLAFQYDTIRIIRRIIRHRRVFMIAVEDVIYWIYVGIRIFIICFYVNSGIIRSFIVVIPYTSSDCPFPSIPATQRISPFLTWKDTLSTAAFP